MKKQSQKKLTLGKITVAHLSKADQQMVKGGLPIQYTKRSVCAEACCVSDVNAQCRTL
ncbi:MAG TPA: class I lanthipeptide [Chitinophaga sp.]|uniref:class I lanthipeptide n=1 Tax=Chitinophaga sp. TaxID=1869181 RepID=UPI002DB775BE|nr:class I lanthipeptide [Chitinophaga sp.]HEU4552030.1 class I lanthipeptide [Chitinophaga sp.]